MTQQSNGVRRILVLDDDPGILAAIARVLGKDFEVTTAGNVEQARSCLAKGEEFSVVIADQRLTDGSGIALLKELKSFRPNTARILITGQMELTTVVEAINRAEIHRFILKPWDNDVLRAQIYEAAKLHDLLRERNEDDNCALPNRRYFHEMLSLAVERALRGGSAFAVIVVDIDRFKDVNDTLGHLEGDRLLRIFGGHLRAMAPAPCLVARVGGDEFSILCPDLPCALKVAGDAHEKLGRAVTADMKLQVPLTISLGIAAFPDHGGADRVYYLADQALLQAKRSGRDRIQLPINGKAD